MTDQELCQLCVDDAERAREYLFFLEREEAARVWVEILRVPASKRVSQLWFKDDEFRKFVRSLFYEAVESLTKE